MNKKDRIAVVVSFFYLLFPFLLFLEDGNFSQAIVVALPVILYWGYRFIKGDISFINDLKD